MTADPGAAPSAPAADAGILATKLFAPRSRYPVVRRPRLDRLLDRSTTVPLTLLVAPAGWGKSTLVADWLRRAGHPAGWVWLERTEDDPVRFWRHVLHALVGAAPSIGRPPLDLLDSAGADIDRDVLPALANTVVPPGTPPVLLVLDDLHAVRNPAIHEQLGRVVEHRPAALHLVVLTRSDPPLPVGRLRVRDALVEIRSDDLHFTAKEAGELMRFRLGPALSDADVRRLVERTEGWAAGLHLVALRLRDRSDPSAFIARFSGADRHLVDYLGEEVLAALDPIRLAFLLRTSVLTRLCAPLCVAVTGRPDSALLLDEIDRAGMFLTPLDDEHRWLRYHQLFRDILLHELSRTAADEIPDLHRRAAIWYAAEGDTVQAIAHALASGDDDLAVDLVGAGWRSTFNAGQTRTVDSWLAALPPATVSSDLRLSTARLWLAMDAGRLDTVAVELDRIDATGTVDGQIRLMRVLHTFKSGSVADAAGRLAGIAPTDDAFDQTVRSLLVGVTALWLGEPDRAAPALDEATRSAERDENRLAGIYATGCRALTEVLSGAPDAARWSLSRASSLTARVGDRHFVAAFPALARARLALAAGDPSAAVPAALEAVDLAERGAGRVELAAALITAAHGLRLSGDPADDRLARARALLAECAAPGPLVLDWLAAAEQAGVDGSPGLTDRELDILRLLPGPLTQRELAATLFVSPNTLKTHLRAIYRKLGADSRADAVSRAHRSGLL